MLNINKKPRSLCCGDGNSISLTRCNRQQDAHRENIVLRLTYVELYLHSPHISS
jgi:hypothetical protein